MKRVTLDDPPLPLPLLLFKADFSSPYLFFHPIKHVNLAMRRRCKAPLMAPVSAATAHTYFTKQKGTRDWTMRMAARLKLPVPASCAAFSLFCGHRNSPLVLLVLAQVIGVTLMLALPRQVERLSAALVQRDEKIRAEISVYHVYPCSPDLFLRQ